jgi:uncharacterized membrane protein
MNKTVKLFAEQVLIVLNIFIIFLLLFESKLALPYWLQPVGRMHPMLLHFPIVLLALAMIMNIFRYRSDNNTAILYNTFVQLFLLAGALLSGITVIMGLFLSREEGYAGDTLVWHKWTGVGIFFLATIIYWSINRRWYSSAMAWVSAVVMGFVLIVTGHYGANLSHGEDFILQPILANRKAPVVPVEEAIVFAHVIQPILEKKCVSCHNIHKLKGQLALTDSLSLSKGGKSGKLFEPGNPEISLLLERVHLSPDEKKHMPPAGKPQLTEAEMMLLALWIKDNADYHKKVVDLEEGDSLRIMSTAQLQPATGVAEQFDFAAADEKTISKLNTFYRTIAPIAIGSPALDVNIYNRSAFTPQQLQEMGDIRKQVVALNLNKMPVKDEDVKAITQFEHLRRLDLNFTDVTDKSLDALSGLKYLHTLSLSGTKISFGGLSAKLASFKTLKTVSIWNTGITAPEVAQLRQGNTAINFIEGFKDDGKDTLKLNPPQVKNAQMVFPQDISIQLSHPIKGVQIRYTLDGTEPDSIHSAVFEGNTVVNKNTTVKSKAFKPGWYSSDVIAFDFLKNSFIPDSVQLLFPLNPVHKAEGANTFFNKKLGAIGANNPAWANYWAGARDNALGLVALFYKPVIISSFGLHYMQETETGIYPPAEVEVWGGDTEKDAKLILTIRPSVPAKDIKPSLKMLEGKFKPHTVSYLKIIAKPLKQKKDQRLLLIDEMFLN